MSRIFKSLLVVLTAFTMLLSSTSAADAQGSYPLIDFTGDDPIVCGGQFFGSIEGGLAPYTITHVITDSGGTATMLTPTVLAAAGPWAATNIDYAVVADGTYTVDVSFSDSAGNTDAKTFTTLITDVCASPAPDPGPPVDEILGGIVAGNAADAAAAAAAAGDVAGAEAALDKIEALAKQFPNSAAIKAALASAKASVAAAKAAAAPAPAPIAVPANQLAFTGNEVSLPITAGAILISAGGLMLLAANKRSRKDI